MDRGAADHVERVGIDTPCGRWVVTIAGGAVGACGPGAAPDGDHPLALRVAAYFGGALDALEGLPVDPDGTAFQRAVWAEVARVPVGHRVTYGALAARLGRPPGAARAVGAALGANPALVVVPCHRAVAADGALTGYAAGTDIKAWLLDHEASRVRPTLF